MTPFQRLPNPAPGSASGRIEGPWSIRQGSAAIAIALALMLLTLTGCDPAGKPPQSSPSPATPPTVTGQRLDSRQLKLIEDRRQAVLSDPGSAANWGKLGQAMDAVEYAEEAKQCYEQAVRLAPNEPRWLHLLALLQLQEEPDAALSRLERAADLAQDRPDAPRLRLAQALIERGRQDDAEPHLQRLIRQDPGHAGARLEMARVLLLRNALGPAAQSLAVCFTNRNTARPALLILAQVRQREGNVEEAGRIAERASTLPRQFDWPDPYLREVSSLRADRQKLQDRANSFLMDRQLSEAEKVLAQLLQAYPNDAEGLLLLGRLYYQKKNCQMAEQTFNAHLAARPNSLNGLVQLSIAILCQQRWDDAAVVLRKAIALKPDFATAHYNLGYALASKGDRAGALKSFKDAVRCSPGHVAAHVSLADEYFRVNNRAQGEHHLERALQLEPNYPRARQLREQHPKP